MQESDRVEALSQWYTHEQLDFDKKLIQFRYEAILPYLNGPEGLELGSGEGEMTRLLIGNFQRLTIVEGALHLINLIPEMPTLTKIHSLFESFTPSIRYNTIVMEHILEHIENPNDLLVRTKNWLATNGRVIVGVPNANSFHRLVAVKMGLLSEPTQLNSRDAAIGHRRVYTRDTLQAELTRAGLIVEKMGGVFLKPLSNKQIQDQWTDDMIQGFHKLGNDFPEYTAEIFAICKIA